MRAGNDQWHSLNRIMFYLTITTFLLAMQISFVAVLLSAQNAPVNNPAPQRDKQINVNWFYGSYVPKEVPLESLNGDQCFKLYIRHLHDLGHLHQNHALRFKGPSSQHLSGVGRRVRGLC
jgi:hypothetical protein